MTTGERKVLAAQRAQKKTARPHFGDLDASETLEVWLTV